MKYVVWGAGHRGKVIYDLLGKDRIVAFIDSNPEKLGQTYLGCPIINYDIYKKTYRSNVIIVSMVFGGGVNELLDQDDIFYFSIEKCPPEFMGYGWYKAKEAIKKIDLEITDDLALYGATLYTVLVYEKLAAEGNKKISVILPFSMDEKQRNAFSNMFPEIPVIQFEQLSTETLLLTEKTNEWNAKILNVPMIDIVDWTQYIKEYQNDRIEALKGKYKDRRCFIVATGPSLTYEDLNCLHDNHEFCFSINTIFTCFSETCWRPDCYAVVDAAGVLLWQEQFCKLKDIPYKFIADCQPYFDYASLDDDWYIYHSILDDYSIKNMLFSDDFSKKAYTSATVTYVCIQLAIYFGFREIYLLGVDFSYKKGIKNHFTKQVEPEEKFDGMSEQERMQSISYAAFQKAKEYALKHDIKLVNATRKTNLDVFEQVDFDTLF